MQGDATEQTLVTLIEQLLVETDNEKRGALEVELEKAISEPQYVGALFSAFQNPRMSKSGLAYLMVLVKKLAEKSHLWNEQEGLSFLNHILFLMSSSMTDYTSKKKLEEALRTVLNPSIKFNRSATVQAMRKSLHKNLISVDFSVNNPKLKDKDQLSCLLLCVKSLAQFSYDSYNSSILHDLRQVCIRIFDVAIEPLISSLSGDLFSRTHILSESSQIACKNILEIIELYVRSFFKVNDKIKNYSDFKKCKAEDLANPVRVLQILLLAKIGNLNNSANNLLFEVTPFPDFNKRLSVIQSKTIQSLLIYCKAFSSIPSDEDTSSKQLNIVENQLRSINKIILESMHSYFSSPSPNAQELPRQQTLERLLQLSFKYLSVACSDFRFFEPFSQAKLLIFRDIILPNIVASEGERQNFVDNPDEFVNYSFDFIGDKKSGTLKTTVMKFFDELCRYIDGMVTYAFDILIDVLKFVIQGSPTSNIETQYQYLRQITSSAYYLKFSDEAKVESALLMLAALSERIEVRKDLAAVVQQFSLNYGLVFLSENASDLIKSRFMLFAVRYMEIIFESTNLDQQLAPSMLDKALEMSNWILNQIQGNDAKSKIAIKCFFSMLKKRKETNVFKALFVHLAEVFNGLLPISNSQDFLLLIRIFLHKYGAFYKDHPGHMEGLLCSLVSRIKKEHYNRSKAGDETVDQCFNIISMLSNNYLLLTQYFDLMDSSLSSLLPIVAKDKPIWAEHLIDFYITSSDYIKRFSNAAEEIFALAPYLQASDSGRITFVLPLLNRIFTYAPQSMNNSKVKTVIEIANICLSTQLHCKSPEFYYADAFLLLQMLIQNAGSHFTQEDINTCMIVFETYHLKMNVEISQQTIFLRDKIFGLFCSILLQFSDLVLPILTQSNRFSDYVKSIKENLHHFETTYEIKLLVSGMVKALGYLLKTSDLQNQRLAVEILNWLIPYMKLTEIRTITQVYTQIRQKRTLKENEEKTFQVLKELLEYFPAIEVEDEQSFLQEQAFEDEMDSIELFEAEGRRKKEKQQLVQKLITPLNLFDEYSELKLLVLNILAGNSAFIDQLMALVEPLCQKYFKEVIFRMHYVSVQNDSQPSLVLRKIVHFRRK